MSANLHLHDELMGPVAKTQYGPIQGGRAANGAAVFLEVPYALPPKRFADPEPLPTHFRYEAKQYTTEASYAVQPTNDGQAQGTPFEDKVGLGKPTENPLFVNIVAPPAFPSGRKFPVKVYIHGGFLQFGSPHGLKSQAQYIAAENSEVWVNIGYRLSAFGFLASDTPKLNGNYGFKDQCVLTVLTQYTKYSTMCRVFNPVKMRHSIRRFSNPTPYYILRDPARTPWAAITKAIETDALGIEYGTFRGCVDGDWLANDPDPMTWQRNGGLAKGLLDKGVKSVIIGDLKEEWYLYSIAHPIPRTEDIIPNLERYFPNDLVARIVELHRKIPENASSEEAQRLFGEILSNLQVHLPVRIFARDFTKAGFPILRYEIRWTPEQNQAGGYVTHGSDRSLWALRLPILTDQQVDVAKQWLSKVAEEQRSLEGREVQGLEDVRKVLVLKEDKTIGWEEDGRWEELIKLIPALQEKP
ncbi:hypothetical protein ONZ45_g13252 [Pleurotus djamor]|nr:hypothetical protein ONZ45_g13252 [Pleurotus djamor]